MPPNPFCTNLLASTTAISSSTKPCFSVLKYAISATRTITGTCHFLLIRVMFLVIIRITNKKNVPIAIGITNLYVNIIMFQVISSVALLGAMYRERPQRYLTNPVVIFALSKHKGILGPGCTLPPQKYRFFISFEKFAWRKNAANLLLELFP